MLRISFVLLIFFGVVSCQAPGERSPGAQERAITNPPRVLLFSGTGWYRHPEIPKINGWITQFLRNSGLEVDVSESGQDLQPKLLKNYQVILFNNANTLDKVLDQEQRKAVEEWYAAGGGIVGLHALLVRQEGWPWMLDLGGCDFDSDSDFLRARVVVDREALDHPTVRGHGAEFWYTADWTNHTRSVTGLEGVQVLLRVDESTYDPVRDYFKPRGGKAMGADHPVAWTRLWGGGRFFYTELGHNQASLDTEFGRQHLLEGILWAAGRR